MKNIFLNVLIVVGFVVGCATLKSQSFQQKYEDSVQLETTVLTLSTSLRQANLISGDDEQHVVTVAMQTKTILDEALKISNTDISTAQNKLVLASTLLNDLQNYLAANKKVTTP